MRFFAPCIALLGALSLSSAAPIAAELPDGLPYPSPNELHTIEKNAHGTLPNPPPPPVISNKGINNLRLIAFNELFEVAYFNQLIANITKDNDGYHFPSPGDKDYALKSLKAILAVSAPSSRHVIEGLN